MQLKLQMLLSTNNHSYNIKKFKYKRVLYNTEV